MSEPDRVEPIITEPEGAEPAPVQGVPAGAEDSPDGQHKPTEEEMDAHSAEKAKAKKAYVRYTGTADERGFTTGDLRRAGVYASEDEDAKPVWWNSANDWRVLKQDLVDLLGQENYHNLVTRDASLQEVEE